MTNPAYSKRSAKFLVATLSKAKRIEKAAMSEMLREFGAE